jgi:hypothetical protein
MASLANHSGVARVQYQLRAHGRKGITTTGKQQSVDKHVQHLSEVRSLRRNQILDFVQGRQRFEVPLEQYITADVPNGVSKLIFRVSGG